MHVLLKGGSCCQHRVCGKAGAALGWMYVSNGLLSLHFFSRANTPKLTFGGSTATPATGITGGFGFGSSAPTSVPSSQAAAPSGFVFGSAGSTSSTTAQSGTTGGFTFSSGTTTQAGTTGFNIGTAAPQAAPSGLTFGTAAAAAATTAATSGAVTQSTTPFSLGGQSAGGAGA